jgi:hypothetical protein
MYHLELQFVKINRNLVKKKHDLFAAIINISNTSN